MYLIIPKITKYLRIKPFLIMMPEKLYVYTFHNDLEVMIELGEEKDGLYKHAKTDLSRLIMLLKEELQ